jgi:hypothetical protein
MDLQKIAWVSLVPVLILATSSIALGDQSLSSSELNENGTISPHGHIEDVSWVKKVSTDGVIEIDGITFSIVNNDENSHLYEVCAVIEGPIGEFTSSVDNSPACTSFEMVNGNEKLTNQSIDFFKGVKVSDLIDISIIIQEV